MKIDKSIITGKDFNIHPWVLIQVYKKISKAMEDLNIIN